MERLINGGSAIIPGQAGFSIYGCHSLSISGSHFRYEHRQSDRNLPLSTSQWEANNSERLCDGNLQIYSQPYMTVHKH